MNATKISGRRGPYWGAMALCLVWASIGAGASGLFWGEQLVSSVLFGVALVAWPFRLRVERMSLKADSFEEAMREIEEIERREGR